MLWRDKFERVVYGPMHNKDLPDPALGESSAGTIGSAMSLMCADVPPGIFSAEEQERLRWLREHIVDVGEKREELFIVGRLYFARWLVTHGRIGEF